MKLATRRDAVLAGVGALLLLAAPPLCAVSRDALRVIVQEQCVPHWLEAHDPTPCLAVHLGEPHADDPAGLAQGYAVLADQKGGAHLLLIPTRTIAGIESPELLAPGVPNYFAAAWQARARLSGMAGHLVPRSAVEMVINRPGARSQDQLHIHVTCLSRLLYDELQAHAGQLRASWSPIRLAEADYKGLRVMGRELGAANPFQLLANGIPGARGAMGSYVLMVVGMEFRDGPGFAVLTGTAVPPAEKVRDSSCAVALDPPAPRPHDQAATAR